MLQVSVLMHARMTILLKHILSQRAHHTGEWDSLDELMDHLESDHWQRFTEVCVYVHISACMHGLQLLHIRLPSPLFALCCPTPTRATHIRHTSILFLSAALRFSSLTSTGYSARRCIPDD